MTSLPLSSHHVTFARTTWRWICMTLPQVKILWRCSNPTLTSYQNNGCCCSLLLTLAWSGWIGETAVPVAVHLPESGSLTILWKSVIIPTPPPYKYGGGGVYWNHFVRLSVGLSVRPSVVLSVCPIVSAQYLLNRSTIFFFTKLGIVVYYDELMCHAEKLVHYLQCQGHSEGLYNQNIIMFTIYGLLVRLWPNLVW